MLILAMHLFEVLHAFRHQVQTSRQDFRMLDTYSFIEISHVLLSLPSPVCTEELIIVFP